MGYWKILRSFTQLFGSALIIPRSARVRVGDGCLRGEALVVAVQAIDSVATLDWIGSREVCNQTLGANHVDHDTLYVGFEVPHSSISLS